MPVPRALSSENLEVCGQGAQHCCAPCAPKVQGRSGGGVWLRDRVAVGVDFVDFAYVQGANAGFYFTHIANNHPD